MDLIARLKEPSSWAAIAAGLAAFGFNIPSGLWQAVVGIGTGVAVFAGVLLGEKSQ